MDYTSLIIPTIVWVVCFIFQKILWWQDFEKIKDNIKEAQNNLKLVKIQNLRNFMTKCVNSMETINDIYVSDFINKYSNLENIYININKVLKKIKHYEFINIFTIIITIIIFIVFIVFICLKIDINWYLIWTSLGLFIPIIYISIWRWLIKIKYKNILQYNIEKINENRI